MPHNASLSMSANCQLSFQCYFVSWQWWVMWCGCWHVTDTIAQHQPKVWQGFLVDKPCHTFGWCQLSVLLVGRQWQFWPTSSVEWRPTLMLADIDWPCGAALRTSGGISLLEFCRKVLSCITNEWFVFCVLQLIPQISSLNPVTTAIPLAIVLGITAVKDLIDDIVSEQHLYMSVHYLTVCISCAILNWTGRFLWS